MMLGLSMVFSLLGISTGRTPWICMMSPKSVSDFPILSREVNGKPLVYLDNGASAQKPQVVIDAITRAYSEEYANVHRGLHYLPISRPRNTRARGA